MTPTDQPEPPVWVSIIVPVYNDPEGIEQTLDALVGQTYPREDHEIVVIDNGSTDRTPAAVARYCRVHEHVRSITEPRGGSYFARNTGIEAARGAILAFVDADETVGPTWLARLVDRLDATGAAYLACAVEMPESDCPSYAERYVHQTAFPIDRYVNVQRFAPTCCLTVRRSVVEDIGAFDPRMTSSGDREFGNRVDDAGYELEYAGDIVIMHPPRRTLSGLVSKAVRIGRGTYQLRRYYPDRYGRPLALLVNPATYTPPLPGTMADSLAEWDRLSVRDRLVFTALSWLLTLARAYGKLAEALAGLTARFYGSGYPANGSETG
jgi:glycosyltransferase involved in cell wall biosynthesis